MTTTRDYYDILGVSKTATAAELKSAYRKQALQWHPDRNKSTEAETKFKEINEAYEILSNTDKRAAYDQYGHAAFEQGAGGPGGFGGFGNQQGGTYRQGPFTYTYGAENFDFSDPFEIFEQFFGGASPFGRQGRQIPHYSLSIDFDEAVHGVEKTVEIDGKRKTIKIPAGVDNGSRIKFQDFTVTLDVKPDSTFTREGDDLIVNVFLPLTMAILGGVMEVPTIEGDLKLKIRSGTQPGTMIRLRGEGVKRLHSSGRGDQYVRLQIKIPEKLTRRQKELLEEFEKDS
jgi:molecular chaperone DnaJ